VSCCERWQTIFLIEFDGLPVHVDGLLLVSREIEEKLDSFVFIQLLPVNEKTSNVHNHHTHITKAPWTNNVPWLVTTFRSITRANDFNSSANHSF